MTLRGEEENRNAKVIRPEDSQGGAGNARAFRKLGRSPWRHMSKLDAAVWERFLAGGGGRGGRWVYDLRLGLGSLHCPGLPEELQPAWLELACKRVDAVGFFDDRIELVEVKPMASMSALGQVLSYGWLFKKEKDPQLPLLLRVVCGRQDSDLIPVFTSFGVAVVVV